MTQQNLRPKNFILRSLSEKTFSDCESDLERVEMPLTKLLYQPWATVSHVYFPETSVISVVSTLENGSGVESGVIGKEGVLGAMSIFAREIALAEATVQLGGDGWRMNISAFKNLFDNDQVFRKIVLSYVFTFVAQITQNSVCLCYHTVEKRLARWLLMFQDRADSEKLILTQEFIAQMLGVHRPSVSKNAKKLQSLDLIQYGRGVVKILDRKGLESYACECYEAIKKVAVFCDETEKYKNPAI